MASVVHPGNDFSRLAFLTQAYSTASTDQAKGNLYIMGDTFTKLIGLLPPYSTHVKSISSLRSHRIQETGEKGEAISQLLLCIKHAQQSVINRVIRRKESTAVLTYYGIPQSGQTPRLRPNNELLTVARSLVKGDSLAVEAGFAPMVNPDAAEVSEAIKIAEQEITDFITSDRKLDDATEELAQIREAVIELINDIIDELRFNLRKMDDVSARRIMRTYGVEFEFESAKENLQEA